MTPFVLLIPGEPVPKGRPRMNTKTGRAYTPERTKAAERTVAEYAMANRAGLGMPWEGTLKVTMSFVASKQGDLDNYTKLVLDALNGVAYLDDRQIISLDTSVLRDKTVEPETFIVIERVADVLPAKTKIALEEE